VKKNYHLLLLSFLFLAICNSFSSAQIIPSSIDLSYLLNPNADLHLTHKVVSRVHKKWVILEVEIRNDAVLDSLQFSYSFTNKLDNPLNNFIEVGLKDYELLKSESKRMYAFEPTTNNFNFLILRILNNISESNYTYIINLDKYSNFFVSKTDLTIPFVQAYSNTGSSIKIANLEGVKSNFGLKFYTTNFSAALPPMANLKSKNNFEKADTSYSISSNDTLLTMEEGVYSIFEENNEKTISFFKITNSTYPQLSNISEIIDASVYLFTKKEKDKLDQSSNPKKDYDSFWLENTNSSERAGKMISTYFSRVKISNSIFSTYKEGWKTDMGMIYIIFGAPNKIFRSDGSIKWVYKKTYEMPNLVFDFYLKNENLDTEYFELERNIRYQNTWFRAIDLWRKGRKNL
jgi:GWxTD domain-containing protein